MEINILDDNFNLIHVIDTFQSFIWTERYNGYGDFELYTKLNKDLYSVIDTIRKKMELHLDCYVYLKERQNHMFIETIEITKDEETGDFVLFSGRGLESLLDRRIIWKQTTLNANVQNAIKKVIEDAIINPTIFFRKISNFSFSTLNNETVNDFKMKAQYTGDNLYDVVYNICDLYGMGFDIRINLSDTFVFSLTFGEDRSIEQEINQPVIFSTNYENIVTTDYLESLKNLKNVTLVAGEDSGRYRKTQILGNSWSGVSRRELFTDARDIQSELEDGETLSSSEYNLLLEQRGSEKLAEHVHIKSFSGEIDPNNVFVYGVDYFNGDILQILNEFEENTKIRLIEVSMVWDETGYHLNPTFQNIKGGD